MGLDSIELVMELEDHYNISIPDDQASKVRTVADLANMILSLLPATLVSASSRRRDEPCPTAQAFFKFRREVMSVTGVDRACVRPSTRLDALFPSNPHDVWAKLREMNGRLPGLEMPPLAAKAFFWVAVAVLLVVLSNSAYTFYAAGTFFGMAVLYLGIWRYAAGVAAVHRMLARRFPKDLVTVADVARTLVPRVPDSMFTNGQTTVTAQQVLDDVRRIVANHIGRPHETVLPQSEFIKDLGFG